MPDSTEQFFESLRKRGHEPLLDRASGTLRFDLDDDGSVTRWLVSVEKGDIAVSHRNRGADCTVRADKQVFDQVASGKMNPTAAAFRGALQVEGDPELLIMFQRLFPDPPR